MPPHRVDVTTAFATAILDRGCRPPAGLARPDSHRTARGFEVYRNNFRVNLREALAAAFPVCERLVGEEFFAALSGEFVTREPPRSPVLLEYGAAFGDFIESFPPTASLPYLADVARLEWCWNEAYHAAEATAAGIDALTTLSPDELASAMLALHPSLRIVSSRWPVRSIWLAHQQECPDPPSQWEPESALVSRPHATVVVDGIDTATAMFIEALRHDGSVADAAADACEVDANFDAGAAVVGLVSSGLVVSIRS